MADTSGMADIRGIDIDKLAKGFAERANKLKRFVAISKTSAREMRWYSKTAGFLDTPDTTGITKSHIYNSAQGALPFVAEQSWTRNTSYVRKFFISSPLITMEDIKDSDPDVLATNVHDLVRGVARQVDQRIIAVLTEAAEATPTVPAPSDINTTAATGGGWDDTAAGDIVLDLETAKQKIRAYDYQVEGNGILLINSIEYKHLVNFLISVKGSSIPQFASDKISSGVVTRILGLDVVVDESYTTNTALVFLSGISAKWKSFMGITSKVIDDPGIGKYIRVWEEGECLLVNPKSVHLTTATIS